MKLLYFAWLRTRIGKGEETLTPPAGIRTVGALLDWLKTRSPGHAEAPKNLDIVRVAVNQEHVRLDAPVGPNDEVALFPPVTGG